MEKTDPRLFPRISKSWEQRGPGVPPSCPETSRGLHSSWMRERPHSPSGEFWESCNQSPPPLHPKLQCLMCFYILPLGLGRKRRPLPISRGNGWDRSPHSWMGQMWGVWGAWGGSWLPHPLLPSKLGKRLGKRMC